MQGCNWDFFGGRVVLQLHVWGGLRPSGDVPLSEEKGLEGAVPYSQIFFVGGSQIGPF